MYWYVQVRTYVCTVMYLYSTATLYSKSSDGVNLFFSSSSKSRKKPPSKASACFMHPVVQISTCKFIQVQTSMY